MTIDESVKQCREGVLHLVKKGLAPHLAIEHYFKCAYMNGQSAAMIELQEERWGREESETVCEEGVPASVASKAAAHTGDDRGTGHAQ